ncbi:GH25 family lysozyme [Thermoactinospora rubra]|uniref:GH25 family lysozyme n=1 Tax=Thermoactinospora rubra TaxID=1088767 RepID=UPI0013020843|nr:GH25 family lysozyme [Thermoactinospora rubra]
MGLPLKRISVTLISLVMAIGALWISPRIASADTVTGIDVSHHQADRGVIDWNQVRNSGKSFAFIKATDGNAYSDPTYGRNYAGAKAAALVRGAYHFARPDASANDAIREAQHFVAYAGTHRQAGDLPPALDMENNGGLPPVALIAWTRDFLNEVERLTGRVPVLYTSPGFWESSMANTREFTRYPLWLAHYTTGAPRIPGGWGSYTFWQYTDAGSVPGVVGNVDVNRFRGTLSDLQRLAMPGGSGPEPWKPVRDELAVVSTADGRLEMFWAGPEQVWHRYQVAVGGGWSEWRAFGGPAHATLVAMRNPDGRFDIIAANANEIWHRAQSAPAPASTWYGWEWWGGGAYDLEAAQLPDGRWELFGSHNTGIMHIWQITPSGRWNTWTDFGGPGRATLEVMTNPDGRLDIVAANEGVISHRAQSAPAPASTWYGWEWWGGGAYDLEAAQLPDGRWELFGSHNTGIMHIWQITPSGRWNTWTDFGGPGKAKLAVMTNPDGRLDIVAAHAEEIRHRAQSAPAPASTWYGWEWWGGGAYDLEAAQLPDGRWHLFGKHNTGIMHIWQTTPSGRWNDWTNFGNP